MAARRSALVLVVLTLAGLAGWAKGFLLHTGHARQKISTVLAWKVGQSGGYQRSHSMNIKKLRFARILRDEVSEILQAGEIKFVREPLIGLDAVVIHDVAISDDLDRARVYVSISGNVVENRALFVWLNEHAGKVRHALAQRLRHMKRVPVVTFHLVSTTTRKMMEAAFTAISKEGLSVQSGVSHGEDFEDRQQLS